MAPLAAIPVPFRSFEFERARADQAASGKAHHWAVRKNRPGAPFVPDSE